MQKNIRAVDTGEMAEEIKRLIAENKSVTVTARGNSMNPVFRDRKDKVTLSAFNTEKLKSGDVILALTTNGNYVIHRIIKKNADSVILLGDGNITATETALLENIIGIVTEYFRNGKRKSCASMSWKTYSRLWMALKPVRKYLLAIWRRL